MQGLVLAIARVLIGFVFLVFGFAKLFLPAAYMGKSFVEFFPGYIQQTLTTGHPYAFWRPILEHVVAPNATLFAYGVGIAEFLLGLSLLLGFFARWSSLGGILLLLSVHWNDNPFQSADPFWAQVSKALPVLATMLLLAVFFATNAGATLGLDGGKKRKKAKSESEDK